MLCLAKYEVMAANYSTDCDCPIERHEMVERGELETCCWDGIEDSEVFDDFEYELVKVHDFAWPTNRGFKWDDFHYMGPFEAWDDDAIAAAQAIRSGQEIKEKQR